MGFLLTAQDFPESIFHKKRTSLEWLLEIVRLEKLKEQMIPWVVPKGKRTKIILKKPREEVLEPKKERSFDLGPKVMHSAVDSLIKTNSLKRNLPTREDDHALESPRKRVKFLYSDVGYEGKSEQTVSLKRNWLEDDVDFVPVECKKRKKVTQMVSFKSPRKKQMVITQPSQDLPEDFKRRIEGLGGTNVSFVIEKNLTVTDLTSGHNRMSMPVNQLASIGFLETEEINGLEKEETMNVRFIDPQVRVEAIALRRWNMAKSEGKKGSKMYVLKTQWNSIASKNRLRPADLVQVWAFRVNGELGLALVVVKRSNNDVDDQSSEDCHASQVAEITKQGISPNASGAGSETKGLDPTSPSNVGGVALCSAATKMES